MKRRKSFWVARPSVTKAQLPAFVSRLPTSPCFGKIRLARCETFHEATAALEHFSLHSRAFEP